MPKKFNVEVTKKETRIYRATVAVELTDEEAFPPPGCDIYDGLVEARAQEAAHELNDADWEDATDLRGNATVYDTGEIEEVEDV